MLAFLGKHYSFIIFYEIFLVIKQLLWALKSVFILLLLNVFSSISSSSIESTSSVISHF